VPNPGTNQTPSNKRGFFIATCSLAKHQQTYGYGAYSGAHLLLLLNTPVDSEPIDWVREPPAHAFCLIKVMEES